jgi:HlyD family secretion protein
LPGAPESRLQWSTTTSATASGCSTPVVDERLARFPGSVFSALAPADASAAALVETIVRRVYDAAEQMPWMPPIWIREIVSEGGTLRDRMLRHFPRDAVGALIERLAGAQRGRRIPAGIEPRLAFLTIAGVAMLPLATRPVVVAHTRHGGPDERAVAAPRADRARVRPDARAASPTESTMIGSPRRSRCRAAVILCALALAGCDRSPPPGYQGYVEGEFVHVSSPIAGRLDQLLVKRGDQIDVGARLFALEAVNEAAALRQAQEQLKGAQAQLADLNVGKRPPEQDVTRAQLQQAQVDEQKAANQLARDEAQFAIGGISRQQLDDSRAARAAAAARSPAIAERVDLSRRSRAAASKSRRRTRKVAAAQAAVDQARWKLDQKTVVATRAGRVFDTPYRVGEWVAAGNPVVRMLPPQNVKVRFFVPETIVGGLAAGRNVSIHCDGCAADVPATLSYVSTEAEFTPPIIYSNETRGKLVFMIEARPSADAAMKLNPGQPVSVRLQ